MLMGCHVEAAALSTVPVPSLVFYFAIAFVVSFSWASQPVPKPLCPVQAMQHISKVCSHRAVQRSNALHAHLKGAYISTLRANASAFLLG